MNTVEIITCKRNGGRLDPEQIRYMVQGFTQGSIPDYQMAAFLMAVWFQGLDREETICLTREMKLSGDQVSVHSLIAEVMSFPKYLMEISLSVPSLRNSSSALFTASRRLSWPFRTGTAVEMASLL